MPRCLSPLTVVALVAAFVSAVEAQDSSRVGLVVAAPSSIGVLWQVTPGFALRPELAVSYQSITGNNVGESTAATLGISAMVTTHRWDRARLYVAPRVGYSGSSTATTGQWTFSLSYGAEIIVHRHAGLFGEVGVQDTYQNLTFTTANLFATRSAFGLIIFF